ncbi:MAG: YtxH domain-containing protein [Bacteroidota bacterium]|jgi:gas vesicle protein
MKSGKIFLGILAAFAGGALMGILLAPEKGSRTRRNIINKGEDYADDVKDKLNGYLDTINKKYETAMHDMEVFVSDGKGKHDDAKKEMKNSTL